MANVKAEVVDCEPEEDKDIGDGFPNRAAAPRLKSAITGGGSSAPKKTKGRDEAAAEADRFAAIRSLSAIDDTAIPSFVNYYARSDEMRGILSDIFYFACRNKNFSGWTDKSKPSSISATMANVKAEVVDFEPEEEKDIGDGSPNLAAAPRLKSAITGGGSSAPKKTKGRDEAAAEADRFAAIRSLSAIDDAAIPSFVNYYASSDEMRGILSDIFYFACRNKNFSGWTDSLMVKEKKRPIDDIAGSSGNGGAAARRIRQRSVHIRADAEVSADDIQPATLDSAGARLVQIG